MFRSFIASTALVFFAVAALADTRQYDFDGFTGVAADSGLNVEIVAGPDFSVSAEGTRRWLDRLELQVTGDRLEISRPSLGWARVFLPFLWFGRDGMVVRVSLPVLADVSASAGSNVQVSGGVDDSFSASALSGAGLTVSAVDAADVSALASSGANLTVTGVDAANVSALASSGANLSLAGRCDALISESSSGAGVKARELACDTAEARVSSGAMIALTARDLNAEASSGGNVNVWGAESVEALELSGGNVSRHD